jgi:hypothetical protein
MRHLVREYVGVLHSTYLGHVAGLPPGQRAALPLLRAEEVTVVAAAARRLHLVATTDRLPRAHGPEVVLHDELPELSWSLRFYDPSVLPGLGTLAEDSPAEVRRTLGIADTVYHLAVAIGGGLDGHNALHSGVALANQHTRTVRDLDRLRHALPHRAAELDELADCLRLGLDRAGALLAAELTSGRVRPTTGATAASSLEAVVADVLARADDR